MAVLCFSQLWPDPPLLFVLCMLHHSDAWCRPFVHACCVYYFNMKEGRQHIDIHVHLAADLQQIHSATRRSEIFQSAIPGPIPARHFRAGSVNEGVMRQDILRDGISIMHSEEFIDNYVGNTWGVHNAGGKRVVYNM